MSALCISPLFLVTRLANVPHLREAIVKQSTAPPAMIGALFQAADVAPNTSPDSSTPPTNAAANPSGTFTPAVALRLMQISMAANLIQQQQQTPASLAPPTTPTAATAACFDCPLLRARLHMAEERTRQLETKTTALQNEISRHKSRIQSLSAQHRQSEDETRRLRQLNEQMRQRLLQCQERTMLLLQSGGAAHSADVLQGFLADLLQTTVAL